MSKEFKAKLSELRRQTTTAPAPGAPVALKRGRGRPKKVISPAPSPIQAPPTREGDASALTDQALTDPAIKEKTIKAISGVVVGVFDFWAGIDGIKDLKVHEVQAETLAEKIYDVLVLEKPDFKLNPRLVAYGALAFISFSIVKPRIEAVKKERERRAAETKPEQAPGFNQRPPLVGDVVSVVPRAQGDAPDSEQRFQT